MSTKAWIIFTAVCVIVFSGLVIWSARDRVDVSKIDTNKLQSKSGSSGKIGDHVFGNTKAKVILIEYGDFQCPGCGSAHPIVKTLSEKYKDEVAFVFRNFPLTQIHPNARAAAAAVEAAGMQGKYWEMHNLVFENQTEWSNASATDRGELFASYAQRAGLDKKSFNAILKDESVLINKKIDFDRALGSKLGVNSTPTFYLNGKKLSSDSINGEEVFEKVLVAELKKQGVALPDSKEE